MISLELRKKSQEYKRDYTRPRKNIKDIWYDHFQVLYVVGDNSSGLILTLHMFIYYVVNVENKKLHEPSMFD